MIFCFRVVFPKTDEISWLIFLQRWLSHRWSKRQSIGSISVKTNCNPHSQGLRSSQQHPECFCSLPYFRPKYTVFHTLFQIWLLKCIPYFRPCDVWQIRQLSIDLWRTGLRDAPNDVCVFFFAINVHGSTCYSKHGIPDQIDGIGTLFQTKMVKSIPYFRLEMLENDTLWGGTYL